MGGLTFVLGGIRSGKSALAERLAAERAPGGRVLYVATAQVRDEEMRARVLLHQIRRPGTWETAEEPLRPDLLIENAGGDRLVLLDCVNVFLSNVLLEHVEGEEVPQDGSWDLEMRERIEEAVQGRAGDLVRSCRASLAESILVSNEVGMTLVAPTPLGRLFQEIAGRAHQLIAAAATDVYFTVAGIPRRLK